MSLPGKYFWYGSEGEDDSGWGCVYRSFQTQLANIQGTHVRVPTIAELLLDIFSGQTPPGGRQRWIEPGDTTVWLRNHTQLAGSHGCWLPGPTEDASNAERPISLEPEFVLRTRQEFAECLTKNLHWGPIVIDDGIYSFCILSITNSSIR